MDIVQDAVLFMRTMAYTRESMCGDIFPGADYGEQIHQLADLCDTLVPGLRPNRSHRPADALQYTWDSRNEAQQRWIRQCLAGHGLRVEDLIETPTDHHRIQPT